MIYAKVMTDSISPAGDRLTTMEVQFWRPMLPEFNTYRKFSRNSASSRARPLFKQNKTGTLDMVILDPAGPEEWVHEKTGMSGGEHLEGADLDKAFALYDKVKDDTINSVKDYLSDIRGTYPKLSDKDLKDHLLHKSMINRLLEPFMWHKVIVTSTDWDNYFEQRCHPDAQPEIRILAEKMREALEASRPTPIKYGEYHTPYIAVEDSASLQTRIKASVARCARVSYLTHDGDRNIQKDVELFEDKLMAQDPPHYSPMEHVAFPAKPKRWFTPWRKKPLGNFTGWEQIRHNIDKVDI